jgi:hypothetical protein
MNLTLKCAAIVALLGWSLRLSALSAQVPAPAQPAQIAPAEVATPPGTIAVSETGAAQLDGRSRPLLNNHGLGCAADPNEIGCGNCWTQLRFMFSSCRTFFGEPCPPRLRPFGFGGGTGNSQKCWGN